jgi:pantoate--beta-alanine ligase
VSGGSTLWTVKIVHDRVQLAREVAATGGVVAFVPTMGALHDGHGQLIRRAAQEPGTTVVVSIFVNPTQFDDPKDFARYPKTLDSDAVICEAAGASIVYAPSVEDVYPPGEVLSPAPIPPQATTPRLEDGQRRGHFEGVCTVVKRLFELVRPSVAYFGEKDWQQLQVIAAMTKLAGLGVTIAPVETVRDPDGLAMSSRNRFLSPEDRVRGLSLSRALRACQRASTPMEAEGIMRAELEASQVVADYAVVRDAATLMPVAESSRGPWRALIAARVGSVRLIDNAAWH